MATQLKQVLMQPKLLTPEIANTINSEIMKGNLGPSQIGAFLVTLKLLGKDSQPSFIASIAKSMREAALQVETDYELVDIVGTGGDGQDTFNVSTAASIVAAGAGCKHGNRASSSSCGSADVLEALGCKIQNVSPELCTKILDNGNFCFLFAQVFHPSMKYVSEPRKELGVRTIFNILGPLINPAKASKMIVGVYKRDLGRIMAETLILLGVQRAWVVCGAVGLDEISPEGETYVWETQPDGSIAELVVSPKDFGLPEHPLTAVKGGDSARNSNTMKELLDGKLSGPVLDFVLLNSAALLFVSGKALKALSLVRSGNYQEGYNLAYSVKQMKPSEPYTVQALFLTFKMLKMYDDIIDLYATAYEISPNEEWANHWFMGLARKGDYKTLQQAAVKINKEFKSDKYYFWVVVSIYLQSMEKKSSNPKLQLTLAERMMDKAFKDSKEFNYETAQLYLDILKDQGKDSVALDLVQGALKPVYKVEYERKKVCIEYFIKLKEFDNVVDYAMELLRENPEDWSVHEAFLLGLTHKNVDNVLGFYRELQDLVGKDKYLKRGPFLGEYYYRAQSGTFDGIVEFILTYIENFGSLQSCFDDLFPRLHAIPEENIPAIVEGIYKLLNLKTADIKVNYTKLDQTSKA
ncbi:anthranilate phosphoribosyltransferase [Boothiomyces sp. JEL0866]|nr:anthranilate phosphoribosyltransferase [Boothiomyces sp. JEL0866]